MSTGIKVVVVGSGAAGMSAALSAAAGGADVTVLEAAGALGGTTTLSGGAIWIPANQWAAAEGIEDSLDDARLYLHDLNLGEAEPALCEAYLAHAVKAIRTLEERTAIRWELQPGWPDYHAERPGSKREGRALEISPTQVAPEVVARVRRDPYGVPPMTVNEERSGNPPDTAELARRELNGIVTRGRGLIAALAEAVLASGGRLLTGVRADRLVVVDGAVVGVEANGTRFDGCVVLTTGGFERNEALVRTFLRGPVLAPAGPPTHVGDGLRMGMAAGAALGNMSEAWWCPALTVPGETLDGASFHRMLFLDAAKPGGVLVDRNGRRFANEASNYNELGRALHALEPASFTYDRIPAWLVCDAKRRALPLGPLLPDDPDPPWLVRASTVEHLATRIDVSPDRLRATVDRFNDGADRDVDDDYGRGAFIFDAFSAGTSSLSPVREPPFYALRVVPGCLGTKGGLRIDGVGRVTHMDGGHPISGLHAAGNAAASPFGRAYPGPGSTIGPALVFGTLAGAAAAA